MGRRSINTTKSGKYMNPTDQARKEARKKELKKNKKQRQMVRAAVLKGKDPAQILEEMEKIDEMEYNVYQPSPLNEKVLREKRKKLKETFERVMRLYHNDDPELWADLKRKEVEYEKRRLKKQQYYESVKHAQSVQVDEIPLPQINASGGATFPPQGRIPVLNAMPVPPFVSGPTPGILKKQSENLSKSEDKPTENKKKEPPGCPPGPPPDLLEMHELDSDAEDDEPRIKKSKTIRFSDETKSTKETKSIIKDEEECKSSPGKVSGSIDSNDRPKPTSLQQRMLAISGQNIDEFMKEMENVHKKKEQEKESDSDKDLSEEVDDEGEEEEESEESEKEKESESEDDEDKEKNEDEKTEARVEPSVSLPPIPANPPHSITLPSGPPPPPMGLPPAMIFRPPPLRPGIPSIGIRMPPGPPPGRPNMPHGPLGSLPPRLGIRMPPGPPPGMPPARLMHHHQKGLNQINPSKDSKGVTTITAKPQIRNLSADVTRFVPSTLRVKREDKQKVKPKPLMQEIKKIEANKGSTKDDAYMQFMREMQGLL